MPVDVFVNIRSPDSMSGRRCHRTAAPAFAQTFGARQSGWCSWSRGEHHRGQKPRSVLFGSHRSNEGKGLPSGAKNSHKTSTSINKSVTSSALNDGAFARVFSAARRAGLPSGQVLGSASIRPEKDLAQRLEVFFLREKLRRYSLHLVLHHDCHDSRSHCRPSAADRRH